MNKFFGLLLFIAPLGSFAQEYENLLDEVLIKGNNLSEYDQSWKTSQIDSLQILTQSGNNFANLLEQSSLAGLRSRAGVSTASFRGLLSSHTQVLWNGIPLQSPSLGLVDLSTLPSSVYDQASISMGGSSALYGSGALGASLRLDDTFAEQRKYLGLGYRSGQFGLNSGHISFGIGGKKQGIEVKTYFQNDENEFPYVNSALPEAPTETMEGASTDYKGIKLTAFQKIGSGKLFMGYWHHYQRQEIQKPMTSVFSVGFGKVQYSKFHRSFLGYRYEKRNKWFDIRVGWSREDINFSGNLTQTDLLLIKGEYGHRWSERLKILVGVEQQFRAADIADYGQRPEEAIFSVYASLEYFPMEKWKTTLSIRQAIWQGKAVPFSPEFQSDLTLYNRSSSSIHHLARASYNFRIPTLNDQFWDPGGNPQIEPETSIYAETGFMFQKQGRTGIRLSALGFYTHVNGLLVWLPLDSIWSNSAQEFLPGPAWGVINQDELTSIGLEFKAEISKKFSNAFAISTSASWSPLRSRGDEPTAYVPFQTGLFQLGLNYKNVLVQYSLKFTGERAGINPQVFLEPYTIQYLEASYILNNSWSSSRLFLRIDNLADQAYQSFEWYAMPGRRVSAGIKIQIQKLSK